MQRRLSPKDTSGEAGVSVFLTQFNHIDLGIAKSSTSKSGLELRLRVENFGTVNSSIPAWTVVTPLPAPWSQSGPIRLQIHTANDTHYAFTAFPANNPNAKTIADYVSAQVVSGGSGPFVGVLLGAYTTCNGAGEEGQKKCPAGGEAYLSRWRYSGAAQEIDFGSFLTAGTL